MAGTLPAPPPFQPDPLARAGLLGAHTMLARRAERASFSPEGQSSGPSRFRSEQFGFSALLPHGWTRQNGDSFLVQPYGLLRFEDIEVLTPSGGHARIGASIEPVLAARDALDLLASIYVEWTGGRVFASAKRRAGVPAVDLTIALPEGDLLICQLFVDGPRVITIETLHAADSDCDDDVMTAFHRGFEVLTDPDAAYRGAFTSGTYRIR